LNRLEATFRRRVNPNEVTSPELARHLTELSREIGRQIGALVNRRGEIEQVVVGDAFKLELPELGRARAGDVRLRGLRLIHTHLKDEPLTPDDLADLTLLRLDLVCAIVTLPDGLPGKVYLGYLDPEAAGEQRTRFWKTEVAEDLHGLQLDPVAKAEEIEAAFGRAVSARTVAVSGRAILVGVALESRAGAEASMAELKELARTAGVEVVDVFIQARRQLDSRYVIGRGKLEELNLRAMQLFADMIIFDHDLTPSQARHIADRTNVKVLDRTQLILDIFAQHAHSAEGRLQVELAQLRYRLPRLAQRDEGLSRLMGGIGGRGPGETKLEIDRRRVRDRIAMLEKRIDELSASRQVRRQQRMRHDVPILSIVGYTNAGKSTLLNRLTNAGVVAENKLFATLDPTSRRLRFPREREVIITDTVGFIRALPKTLVNAFRATLEELADADLLLHVVDASDPEHPQQIAAVERILESLGLQDTPRLLVFNKCDLLEGGVEGHVAHLLTRTNEDVLISAVTGEGLTGLLTRVEELLWREGKSLTSTGASFQDEPWHP
jgi:GTP-binding protein HflX